MCKKEFCFQSIFTPWFDFFSVSLLILVDTLKCALFGGFWGGFFVLFGWDFLVLFCCLFVVVVVFYLRPSWMYYIHCIDVVQKKNSWSWWFLIFRLMMKPFYGKVSERQRYNECFKSCRSSWVAYQTVRAQPQLDILSYLLCHVVVRILNSVTGKKCIHFVPLFLNWSCWALHVSLSVSIKACSHYKSDCVWMNVIMIHVKTISGFDPKNIHHKILWTTVFLHVTTLP